MFSHNKTFFFPSKTNSPDLSIVECILKRLIYVNNINLDKTIDNSNNINHIYHKINLLEEEINDL